jgi:hypothetical protein
VKAPDKTLAHMAHTVGLTSARLAEHRPEAAQILREIEIQDLGRGDSLPDPLSSLAPERQRIILDMIGELAPGDRAPALRRLAERVEAGELNRAEGSSRSPDPQGIEGQPPRAM